jgi:hypothetical protein
MVKLDTGTQEASLYVSNFAKNLEKIQELKIASMAEIAYRFNYIDVDKLLILAVPLGTSDDRTHFLDILYGKDLGHQG